MRLLIQNTNSEILDINLIKYLRKYKNILLFMCVFYGLSALVFYIFDVEVGYFFLASFGVVCIYGIIHLGLNMQLLTAVYSFGIFIIYCAGFLLMVFINEFYGGTWYSQEVFTSYFLNRANLTLIFSLSLMMGLSTYIGVNNIKHFVSSENFNKFERKNVNILGTIILLLGIYFTIISAPNSLLDASYGASGEFEEHSAMSYTLGLAFLSSAIFMIIYGNNFKDRYVRLCILLATLVVLNFNLLRGDRDGSLTFFICLGGCYFVFSEDIFKNKIKKLAWGLVTGVFVLRVVGDIRGNVAFDGLLSSISQSVTSSSQSENSIINKLDLMPQMYWHLLDTVELVDRGIYFNLKSFINLVPQSIPKILSDAVGYERPRNSAWDLSEYREHGGGFFIIAEAYWNGGIICVGIFASLLGVLLSKTEEWFYKQPKYFLGFFFGMVATFPTCVYYGLQTMFRWIEVWFLINFVIIYSLKLLKNKQI